MISYSPDGSTIYTPNHSARWRLEEDGYEYNYHKYDGRYWINQAIPIFGYMPTIHLFREPGKSSPECLMPSSLSYEMSNDSRISTKPSAPRFQLVKTTMLSTQQTGVVMKFNAQPEQAFDQAYSTCKSIVCAERTGQYAWGHIIPSGYSNVSSVMMNDSITNEFVANYKVGTSTVATNNSISPSMAIESDYMSKTLFNWDNISYSGFNRNYFYSYNIMAVIQSDSYSLETFNTIYIPRVFNAGGRPSYTCEEASFQNTKFMVGSTTNYDQYDNVFRLYKSSKTVGDLSFAMLSGHYYGMQNYRYTSGCPHGDVALSLGSPIFVFTLDSSYLRNGYVSTQLGFIVISLVEVLEIWTP